MYHELEYDTVILCSYSTYHHCKSAPPPSYSAEQKCRWTKHGLISSFRNNLMRKLRSPVMRHPLLFVTSPDLFLTVGAVCVCVYVCVQVWCLYIHAWAAIQHSKQQWKSCMYGGILRFEVHLDVLNLQAGFNWDAFEIDRSTLSPGLPTNGWSPPPQKKKWISPSPNLFICQNSWLLTGLHINTKK